MGHVASPHTLWHHFLRFRITRLKGFPIAGVWILVALTFAAGALAQAPQGARTGNCFSPDQAVDGTIVIADERSGEMLAYDVERAQKRFMPASTFKVPHALFALDAGAVRDEFQVIRWDGVKRDFDGWNQDQTLRSSA